MEFADTAHAGLNHWIHECAALLNPDRIHICDGSQAEYDTFVAQMVADGTLIPLNPAMYPGCYLHRSDPRDVARVEHATFICTPTQDEAGPTNNWLAPEDAKARLIPLFAGAMRGKTLYVVPYLMGPVGSPFARVGVEITDSLYVVASMGLMTRMGQVALDALGTDGDTVFGLHSTGDLSPENRHICHFPHEKLIWSYGSNYGGNALLGKKCHALRIASACAKDEGWMAEHMLLLEVTAPSREKYYFAGAFPSASGKTNLAMIVVPPALEKAGWQARTVGDDIAWMHIGQDGKLWAINPEYGFFGVAPGTSLQTNPNAMHTLSRGTIFTNVALSDTGAVWWEGKDGKNAAPWEYLTDWKGVRRPTADSTEPFAHPNSRFTAPLHNCPTLSDHAEDIQGVPISGILFGGRRDTTVPLVLEAQSWAHGVFLGATMASRTTAAAEGQTNLLKHDPMAMRPFCGYHMARYFQHWLDMGERLTNPPAIYLVNWFRRGSDNGYVWPGFGENLRVIEWIIGRITGQAAARTTPVGRVPARTDLNRDGLDITDTALDTALIVATDEWRAEITQSREYLASFGDTVPPVLLAEADRLHTALAADSAV